MTVVLTVLEVLMVVVEVPISTTKSPHHLP